MEICERMTPPPPSKTWIELFESLGGYGEKKIFLITVSVLSSRSPNDDVMALRDGLLWLLASDVLPCSRVVETSPRAFVTDIAMKQQS
jgi:hypothetical protein